MLKRKLCSLGTSLLKVLPLGLLLVACSPNFSPNTYSSDAVQRASKVDLGVVIGVRKVAISVDSTLAVATGAAAGGIGGSQVANGAVSALSALGGAVVGGLAGSEVGHKVKDTFGNEYIVRKADGDLLSVTQKDKVPLKVGQRVLLIQGTEARIVKDYTQPVQTEASTSIRSPQSPQSLTPDVQLPVVNSPAMSAAGEPVTGTNTSAPVVSNVTVIPVDTEPQDTTQPASGSPVESTSSALERDAPKEAVTNSSDTQSSESTPSAATSSGSLTHGPGSAH